MSKTWQDTTLQLPDKLSELFKTLENGSYLLALDNFEPMLSEGRIRDPQVEEFFRMFLIRNHGLRILLTTREPLVSLRSDCAEYAVYATDVLLERGLSPEEAIALLRLYDSDDRLGLRGEASEAALRALFARIDPRPRLIQIIFGLRAHAEDLAHLPERRELFMGDATENMGERLYRKASPEMRHLLEVMAVFGTPIDQAGIRALVRPLHPLLDVATSLQDLVQRYVIARRRDSGLYELHPLDQEYLYQQVPVSGEGWSRLSLHRLAARFWHDVRRPPPEWKDIEALHANLAEFSQLMRSEDYDAACVVINEIDREYLALWGHYDLLIRSREQLRGRLTIHRLEAKNLGHLATAYLESGDPAMAQALTTEALEISRAEGDRLEEGRWTGNLGVIAKDLGREAEVEPRYEAALAIAREVGDQINEGRWLFNL